MTDDEDAADGNATGQDAGRSRPRRTTDRDGTVDRETQGRDRSEDDSGGIGFTLPPIRLPPMTLPDSVRVVFPVPEPPEKVSRPTRLRVSSVLLVVALADALDAAAMFWSGPETLPWLRAAVGGLLSVVLVGFPGLLYAWELLVILGGVGWLALVPTATLLVLGRMLVSE